MLIEVGGEPFLSHLLRRFKFAGCSHVLIVVGHRREQIMQCYGESAFGLCISYVIQEQPNGTAKALQLAEEFVGGDAFMLSWGDVIAAPSNYIALWERFGRGDCDVCMLINWLEDVSLGADVSLNGENVVGIIEKPPVKKAGWNQSGIFVMRERIFSYLGRVTPSRRGEYEFTDAIKMMVECGERIVAVPAKGYIYELGTNEQLDRLRGCSAQLFDMAM